MNIINIVDNSCIRYNTIHNNSIIKQIHSSKQKSFIDAVQFLYSKLQDFTKQFNNQFDCLDVKKLIFTTLLNIDNKCVQDLRYQRGYLFNYSFYQTDKFSKSFAIYTLYIVIYSLSNNDRIKLLEDIDIYEWLFLFEKILLKYNQQELYNKLYNSLTCEIKDIFLTIGQNVVVYNVDDIHYTTTNKTHSINSFFFAITVQDNLLTKYLDIDSNYTVNIKPIDFQLEFSSVVNKQYLYTLLFNLGKVLDKLKSYKILIPNFNISNINWNKNSDYLVFKTPELISSGVLIAEDQDNRYSHPSFYIEKKFTLDCNTFSNYNNLLANTYAFLKILLEIFNCSDDISLSYFIKQPYQASVIEFLKNPLKSPLEFTFMEILNDYLEIV